MYYLLAIIAISIVGYLVWAYLSDNKSWSNKTESELEEMAAGKDWRAWQPSLNELNSRDIDISRFREHIVKSLLSDTPEERESARFTLVKLYSDMKEQLQGYKALKITPESEAIAKQLIKKYSQ